MTGSKPTSPTPCFSRSSKAPTSPPTSSSPSATAPPPSPRSPTTASPSSPPTPSRPSPPPLAGDEQDSHARFLEAIIDGIRVVNIYLPNGNPIGTDKFLYKLAWMQRLLQQLAGWLQTSTPTVIGGDFNVIPEDIDCHKPASWMRDALFQPETREAYAPSLPSATPTPSAICTPARPAVHYWDYFRKAFETNRGIRIDHFLLSPDLADRLEACTIDRGPAPRSAPPITPPSSSISADP